MPPDFHYTNIYAPDFPPGLDWINSQPLTFQQLRGRIVLLDFWTSSCINCLHALEDIKALENKYATSLVVISIHSGKFTTERLLLHLEYAVKRLNISHPVVNDPDFNLWDLYAIHAWPSIRLIDPTGKIIGGNSGEGIFHMFDQAIRILIDAFVSTGQLIQDEQFCSKTADGPEPFFPNKITLNESKLFVSDSTRHQITVIDAATHKVESVIGNGKPGFADGSFTNAQFNDPQGLASGTHFLIVADRGNHAIRKIDLSSNTVSTLVGSGKQQKRRSGRDFQDLNSPWDVTCLDDKIYIAMAGANQIWSYVLTTGELSVHSGNGNEFLRDGQLFDAFLAQPSGITNDRNRLYFVDSESSSIRWADIHANGYVGTIIGAGLFEFGDSDGDFPNTRLQHPMGICYAHNFLYVADTYNNKIKRIDLTRMVCETFIGNGNAGNVDGYRLDAELHEPTDVVVSASRLYIADTNNHSIKMYDFHSDQIETLEFL